MDNPYQAPTADITQPSDSNQLAYVGFWARTLSYIVDTVLTMLITVPAIWLAVGNLDMYTNPDQMVLPASYWFISIGLPLLYFIGFWAALGTTPGKMLFKAKIVDAKTGGKPAVWRFIVRYIGYIVSSIVLMLGFFWIGWDKRKQGWHDKMAGTLVIKPSNNPKKQATFSQQ